MVRIDVLPDDVLVEMFDFYVDMNLSSYERKRGTEAWQSLVHVCRRWRDLVFGSPRRLNLQLCCGPNTPATDLLDIWPALPLVVEGAMAPTTRMDNVIAALKQSNRICGFVLYGEIAGWQLEEVLAVMQAPFPELKYLYLFPYSETLPVIPDSFLDGSAPRLQRFEMCGIPFPGLPKLLLSATHLVFLHLYHIPHSVYISPEAIAALLSVLSSLEELSLGFLSPQSRPGPQSRGLPPLKRSVIPALYKFDFKGVTEYLEELVTRIDTPQLETLNISFFNQIDFDFRRLAQFINRTPMLRALDKAYVIFSNYSVEVDIRYRTSMGDYLLISISCIEPDWQLSSIEQVCNPCLHPLSTVEDLYIRYRYRQRVWNNDAIENSLWLQLLPPFTAVKNLYLSKEFAPGIAAALQELVGDMITEVLPSLQNIFVEGLEPSGPFRENIGKFVAARQLSDHLIAISDWDKTPT